MNEQKVRDAVKITNELVPWTATPKFAYVHIWRDVFQALIQESYPSNYLTAAVVEAQKGSDETS